MRSQVFWNLLECELFQCEFGNLNIGNTDINIIPIIHYLVLPQSGLAWIIFLLTLFRHCTF